MADTAVKSTEDLKAPIKFTIRLPSLDGQSDIIAQLEENVEDATHPPRLLNISKKPRDVPSPATETLETHIILSTGSGHQKAQPFYTDVLSPILSATGVPTTNLHTTQSEFSILDLTRDVFFPAANAGTPLRLILLSGDGGIVDLVNGLLAHPHSSSYVSPDVVLLPLGTANALYHSTHSSPSNTWGLSALTSRTSKPLHTFTATFSPGSRLLVDEARSTASIPGNVLHGAVVVSWGMHASLVADSDSSEFRKFGIDRFKMAAKEALYPADGSLPHAYLGSVSTTLTSNPAWTPLPEEEHLYTLTTLVSNLERTFCISPSSTPLDGNMYLVHFGPTTGDEAMRIMGLAYQGGKHVEDEKVRYEKVEGLRIEMREEDERWRRVCVDGKIVRVEEGGSLEVRKRVGGVVGVVLGE